MKTFQKTLIAGAMLGMAGAAGAESPHSFSANVALTTDYVYRGWSQTNEGPAVQGGFDYGHASGFYAGIWGSNVEFNENAAIISGINDGSLPATTPFVEESSIELDYYVGFASELDSGLGWDIGFIYYDYPDSENSLNFDFWEVYGGLSYTIKGMEFEPTLGASVAYSDDFFGGGGDAFYYAGSLDLSLMHGFGLGASVGNSDFDAGGDYVDWKVYLSKEFGGFGFELAYTDTDVDGDDLADGRGVFTVSKSF